MHRNAFTVLSTSLLSAGVTAWSEQCGNFKLDPIDGITASLDFSRYYSAGELVNVTSFAGAVSDSDLPAFCRMLLLFLFTITIGAD